MVSRRYFVHTSLVLAGGSLVNFNLFANQANQVMTVAGPIAATVMGKTLIHEHILVDFVGAENYDPNKWNDDDVVKKLTPYLQEVKALGCQTMVECTPNYLGRDVQLLEKLSATTGLHILTNTGYYGGSVNKYLPPQAFTETENQLADRWISEFQNGIDGTRVRPGFIKISVNDAALSDISKKLVRAAGYCHLETGLTIASHTGPAIPAFEEIDLLTQLGVAPDAFIWVHAQNEKDWEKYSAAAKRGAWVSLDGLREENIAEYAKMLGFMKKKNALRRLLVSHDAGWYEPGKPEGGSIRGYTTLFAKLIPQLQELGFTKKDINQLIVLNPASAFTLRVRKIRR